MSCTPTRAGLIAGDISTLRNRVRVTGARPPGSDRGYRPGAFAAAADEKERIRDRALGQLHLGDLPDSRHVHGLEVFFGDDWIDYYTHFTTRPSEGAQFVSAQPDLWEDDAPIGQDGYMTDLITRRTVEFINQNATRPFFIDVAFNAPHSPTQRPDNPVRTPAPGSATRAAMQR